MNKRTVRIGVLDRLPVIHGGVRHLLAPFPDLAVVTSAYDVPSLLYAVRHDCLDVVLVESVDLDRPLGELLRSLREIAPDLRFILFTSAVEVAQIREALARGCDGYVLKHSSPLTLATALRSVAAGQKVLDPEATQALMRGHEQRELIANLLTPREQEVITLLVQGWSNQQIAEHLFVSIATVKYHLTNITDKLGVTGRAQVIAYAYTTDLVPRKVKTGGQNPLRLPGVPVE